MQKREELMQQLKKRASAAKNAEMRRLKRTGDASAKVAENLHDVGDDHASGTEGVPDNVRVRGRATDLRRARQNVTREALLASEQAQNSRFSANQAT